MSRTKRLLICNTGSSNLKCSRFELDDTVLPCAPPITPPRFTLRWPTADQPAKLNIRDGSGAAQVRELRGGKQELISVALGELLGGSEPIHAVGHRIVHGGALRESVRISKETLTQLHAAARFAPLHAPSALEVIDAIGELLPPSVPQYAVFDTTFHTTLPDTAALYPGPYEWSERGIRRYGFHGINHEYMFLRSCELLGLPPERTKAVTCHLGNGCSLAAVDGGRSVDTTMGFTPLEGMMMGTRSGSVDPGLLCYLQREDNLTVSALEELLNKRSGLLGISGLSNDYQALSEAAAKNHPRAALALSMFASSLARAIGAMLASLGGAHLFVFSAGIGENAAALRAQIAERFSFLNIRLDPEKNEQNDEDREITRPESAVRMLVIRAEEDWQIAKECIRLLPAA